MTDPLAHTRAAEIIAAYGGYPARWPDAERAAALAVIAADPELTAALVAARRLDSDLTAWAHTPVTGGDAAAAAQIAMRRPRFLLRWASGTGLAAAVAAGLILLTPMHHSDPVASAAVAARVAANDESTAFTQVFTPTPDEEQVL